MKVPFSLQELLLGILTAGVGLLVILFWLRNRREWMLPVIVGFFARASLAYLHRKYFFLPQGQADAVNFERTAWGWAQSMGCLSSFAQFDPTASYVYSFVLAQLYACTGRAPLMGQMINVVLGTVVIILIAKISERVWGRAKATRAAWFAALFPMLAILSAVTLREAVLVVFFLTGSLYSIDWVRTRQLRYAFLAMTAFLVSAVFHGAMAVAGVAFGLVMVGFVSANLPRVVTRWRVRKGLALSALSNILGVAFVVLFADQLVLNKIGTVAEVDSDDLAEASEQHARARAVYLEGVIPSSAVDFLWQTPIRALYFLYAPFPWDVTAAIHLFGLIDSAMYAWLSYLLWRHRREWWWNPQCRALVLMFVVMALVFSWGTSNFGTALRHRAKIVGVLIALAAPLMFTPQSKRTVSAPSYASTS